MSELDDIIKLPNGLRYFKTDLHIHYPIEIKNESDNYENGVGINDIIDKLIEIHYKLVCFCHHNSIETIRKTKEYINNQEAIRATKIKVLPSIELNLKEDCHLVIIFPENYSEDQIRDLLVDFGLETPPTDSYGEDVKIHYFENTKSIPKKDIEYILTKCKEKGLIVFAPHIKNKTCGYDAKINERERSFFIKHHLLVILECNELPDSYKQASKDLERLIAHINCSDAHNLTKIGQKATWIKMDIPRYKSLQQIIYEPKLRISLEEPISKIHFKVIGLSVDGGKLRDLKIHFNENYNAIIGGTGSGKSSIIDILRFVFNNFGYNNKFKKITLKRLKDIHKPATTFTLYCQNGKDTIKLVRELPSFENFENIIKKKDIDNFISDLPQVRTFKLIAKEFRLINIKIEEIFQPVIFGQNELLNYSFEQKELLEVFNSKINDDSYIKFMKLYQETKEKSNVIDKFNTLNEQLTNFETQLEDINEEIENTRKNLEEINKNFPKLSLYNKEKEFYTSLLKKIEAYKREYDDFIQQFNLELEKIDLSIIDNKDIFQKINEKIDEILELKISITNISNGFTEKISELKTIYSDKLDKLYDEYELKFKTYCKENDIQDEIAMNKYISDIEQERSGLLTKISTTSKDIEDIRKEKTELLDRFKKLDKLHEKLISRWKKYATIFTSKMDGATKIEISTETNNDEFSEILKLLELKPDQIKKIIKIYSPKTFVELFEKTEQEIKEKLKELKFKEETSNKIIIRYTDSMKFQLKLCYDILSINFYLRKNGNYSPINELSTGERCATLLNFVFCQSNEPVFIDQPEDNIDYNYIKDTIKILKTQKYHRQFIIVSHNQNLPVLSDADFIMVMKNIEDKKIFVEYSGSIENEYIYNSILNLEGGKEAFDLRKNKYHLLEL